MADENTPRRVRRLEPFCRRHKDIASEFICDECGGSYCNDCLRTYKYPLVCPVCIGPHMKRKAKRKSLIILTAGIAAVLLVLTPILGIIIADVLEDAGEDIDLTPPKKDKGSSKPVNYTDISVKEDDIYPRIIPGTYNDSGEEVVGVEVLIYVTNHGNIRSEPVKLDVLVIRKDMMVDIENLTVGRIDSNETKEPVIGPIYFKPDPYNAYTIEIILWEGKMVIQKVNIQIKVTVEDVEMVDFDSDMGGDGTTDGEDGGDGGGGSGADKTADERGGAGGFFGFLLLFVIIPTTLIVSALGYSRVRGRVILRNRNRAQVYEMIKKKPGLHYRGLASELGMAMGTLTYHIQTLEREGYIKSQKDGQFKRFYLTAGSPGYVPPGSEGALGASPPATGSPSASPAMYETPADAGDGLQSGGAPSPGLSPAPVPFRGPTTGDGLGSWTAMGNGEGSTKDRVLNYITRNPGCSQQQMADDLGLLKQTVNYNVDQLKKAGSIRVEREGRSTLCYAQNGFKPPVMEPVAGSEPQAPPKPRVVVLSRPRGEFQQPSLEQDGEEAQT